ncbi:MAG: S66 peptidase family protein [Erysipelotrichaceae bacterium]
MKQFIPLAKIKPGDQVAIISPSAGYPGLFPWIEDLGLERLRKEFKLIPKEYPTTRLMNSSLKDRARDVMAAFADPQNKAVFTSIGGSDQIKLIKYLDPDIIRANPKPFFGYSDNTHLHNFLWNLGIPSYYGSAIMTQFAMQGAMHKETIDSLNHALFEPGECRLAVSNEFTDINLDWADKDNLSKNRKMEINDGLFWDGKKDAEGILWGGCVESLIVQAATNKYLPKDEDLDGLILVLETAEDIPDHWVIEYLLTGCGERGWLNRFKAVLVGRPKTWNFDKELTDTVRAEYRKQQRDTVIKVIREYNIDIPIVLNLDFGHTDPQIALPLGNKARILTTKQEIYLEY